jgi:hypothetical protein
MVLEAVYRNLLDASCCNVLVVNGAGALLEEFLVEVFSTL